jgi:glycosyltransferase involved in cell wall biosynthesis
VGVFVGDFTEVKGWNEVRGIVNSNPETFFILVSKRAESYEASNTKCFNRVGQSTLAELHNCSDFFILGSPVETQCLAALEAGFCGLPIVMRKTGIFMDFNDRQRDSIGVFNDDLSLAFREFLSGTKRFSPRESLLSLDFGIGSMVSKWKALLESI